MMVNIDSVLMYKYKCVMFVKCEAKKDQSLDVN